jgi:hypothetical protein
LKSGMNVWTQLKSEYSMLESFYENWDVFSSSIIARNFLTHWVTSVFQGRSCIMVWVRHFVGHCCSLVCLDSLSDAHPMLRKHKDNLNFIRYKFFLCRRDIEDVLCLSYFTALLSVAQIFLFWMKVVEWLYLCV